MNGLSCEMASWILVFQVLQATVAGALLALLLWCEKRRSARRQRLGERA